MSNSASCEECTHCTMAHTGTPYEKQIAFVIDAEVNAAATPESPDAGFHPAPPQLSAAGRSASPGARQISPDLPPDLPRSPHVGGRRSARAPGCTASGPSRRARGGGRVSARLRERRAPARRLSYTGADLRRSSSERCRFFSFLLFSVLGRAGALHAARRRRQPAAEEGEGAQRSSPPSGAN